MEVQPRAVVSILGYPNLDFLYCDECVFLLVCQIAFLLLMGVHLVGGGGGGGWARFFKRFFFGLSKNIFIFYFLLINFPAWLNKKFPSAPPPPPPH